jgi:succinyl-CoA synthetase alpha subunit
MLVEVNPMIVTPEREVKALDAKVTLDGNSLFRHPDNAELRDAGGEDPQEQMAKERGLTYVKLDGNVGILGNGAGLVMSTLDVVAQAGGKPANFLDAGGGSKAEAITQAVEVILSDEKVTAVLFNIFGGITRCDEVARGLIEAFAQIKPTVPFVVRLDGTNDKEGRALLAEADLPNVFAEATMLGAGQARRRAGGRLRHRRARGRDRPARRGHGDRARRGRRPSGGGCLMAILVDNDTKLCVSGITGREGTFHAMNNKRYGTQVVSGVTPGKGGQDVEGVPVFNTFHDAVAETGANTAMIFVPPRFAADSILEAEDAGIALVIAITEGIPAHDELRVYNHLLGNPDCRLIGPNCPGILSPGKANVGIIPASFFKEGNVGVVSRSGTLTYQIGNELAQSGFGNSSIVGIGGDPVPGSSFIDIIELFEADDETELIVMAGEIGGSAEEEAADFIAEHVSSRSSPTSRLHRPARQDDGPRRRDRLRHQGHRRREGRGARGEGRAGRPHPHRGGGDRGRHRRLSRALDAKPGSLAA